MAVDNIKLDFSNTFKGVVYAPHGQVKIGTDDGDLLPYHLLFGALGSCFYSTFLTIVKKKRLTFDGATLEISGKKREIDPPTLEYVKIEMVIKNPSNEEQFLKSAELGAKYCSIHETIKQVAKIEMDVKFEK